MRLGDDGEGGDRPLTQLELRIYARAGLGEEHARLWAAAGIGAYAAESFRSLGVGLDEAKRFQDLGLGGNAAQRAHQLGVELDQAARWTGAGVRVDDINRATQLGLDPSAWAALCSAFDGLTLDQFDDLAKAGMSEEEALSWGRAGVSARSAAVFKALGLTPAKGQAYERLGLDGEAARTASSIGLDLDEAAAWAATGVSPQLADPLQQLDLTPAAWSELTDRAPGLSPQDVRRLLEAGLPRTHLAEWVSLGVPVELTAQLLRAGADIGTIREWSEVGLSLPECLAVLAEGRPVDEVRDVVVDRAGWAALRLSRMAQRCWRATGLPLPAVASMISDGLKPIDAEREPADTAAAVDDQALLPASRAVVVNPLASPQVQPADGGELGDAARILLDDLTDAPIAAAVLAEFGFEVRWEDEEKRQRDEMGNGTDVQGLLLAVTRTSPGGNPTRLELVREGRELELRSSAAPPSGLSASTLREALGECDQLRLVRPGEIIEFEVSPEEFPDAAVFAELLEVVTSDTWAGQDELDWTDEQLEVVDVDLGSTRGLLHPPVFLDGERWAVGLLERGATPGAVLVPLDQEQLQHSMAIPRYIDTWGWLRAFNGGSMVSGTSTWAIGSVTPGLSCELDNLDESEPEVRLRVYEPYMRAEALLRWIRGAAGWLDCAIDLVRAVVSGDSTEADAICARQYEEDELEVDFGIDAGDMSDLLLEELATN